MSLKTSGDISASFAVAFKQRLGWLPMIILDIQDLMNKGEDGLKGVTEIFFHHSNGVSGGRATTSGEWLNYIRIELGYANKCGVRTVRKGFCTYKNKCTD